MGLGSSSKGVSVWHALCRCWVVQSLYAILVITPQRHGTLSPALETSLEQHRTKKQQHTSQHKNGVTQLKILYKMASNFPWSNLDLMRTTHSSNTSILSRYHITLSFYSRALGLTFLIHLDYYQTNCSRPLFIIRRRLGLYVMKPSSS